MATAKLASIPQPAAGSVRYCSTCSAVFRTDFERCPNDGGELVVALSDPLVGAVIGDRYVIEGLIGEGAMGRVYRARHKELANHRYAIKVLIGDLAASSTMRMRFAREAENASRLEHPNVVNVIDFGKTVRGLHYLVMDLVDGSSLTAVVTCKPLPAKQAIRIAHQLCEGLDHAHSRGVIHRDFKSDNILVVGEPGRETVRIADFGLAMSTTSDVRLTTTGVACTPAYAAPEQLRGGAIDHRVDLYGLGVTLFEMLSGGFLPFEGDLDATVAAKLTREAPSILTRAPNVPPGLVTLVSRLLAHDPAQRPCSARAVIRALETSMTLPRPPVRMIDMPTVTVRSARRTRGRAVAGVLLVTALSVIAATMNHSNEPEVVPVPGNPDSVAVAADEPDVRVLGVSTEPVVPMPLVEEPVVVRVVVVPVRTKPKRMLPEPTALEVATKYSAIGRALEALQEERGEERTLDLWRRYRRIEITDAMSSQESRDSTAAVLERLERAIETRR